jgi:hypothetical protein
MIGSKYLEVFFYISNDDECEKLRDFLNENKFRLGVDTDRIYLIPSPLNVDYICIGFFRTFMNFNDLNYHSEKKMKIVMYFNISVDFYIENRISEYFERKQKESFFIKGAE